MALPVLSTSPQRTLPHNILLSSTSANEGDVGNGGGDHKEDHAGSVGSDKLVKYFWVKDGNGHGPGQSLLQ